MDLIDADLQAAVAEPASAAWADLNLVSHVEVARATGVLVAQPDVAPAVALVRLRAHAYATSACEVARDIIDHRLRLDAD